jgi:hypothetical protein
MTAVLPLTATSDTASDIKHVKGTFLPSTASPDTASEMKVVEGRLALVNFKEPLQEPSIGPVTVPVVDSSTFELDDNVIKGG